MILNVYKEKQLIILIRIRDYCISLIIRIGIMPWSPKLEQRANW